MPSLLGLFGVRARSVDRPPSETANAAATLRSLLITLTGAVVVLMLVGIPFSVVRTRFGLTWGCVVLAGLLIALYLQRSGRVRAAAWTAILWSWLTVTAWMMVTGGLRSVGYVVVIVTAAWVLGRKPALSIAALSIVTGFAIAVGENAGRLPLLPFPLPPFVAFFFLGLAILLAAVPTSQMLRNLNEALASSRTQLAELKAQGEALERERGLLEQIWEASQDSMCLVDDNGVLLRVNDALCRMVRKNREDLEGHPFTECLLGADPESHLDRYRRWFAEGVIEQPRLEWFFTIWNKSILPIESSMSYIEMPDGRRALLCISRDNTERIKAEASVQQAQQRMAEQKALADSVIDSLPGTFTMFDEQGRLLGWNRNEEQLTGCTADELTAMNVIDTVSTVDRERVAAAIEEARATGRSSLEVRVKDQAGEDRVHFWTTVALELGGKLRGLCIGIDATELKRAEDALQDALARFEAVVESTPAVAIQGFDRQGRIRHWNRACTTMFGYEAHEVIGRRAQEIFFPGGLGREFEAELRRIWETRVPSPAREWKVGTRDGSEVTMYSSMFPILEHGQVTRVFCMDIDMTRVHSLEEQLFQAQKLESLGGLAGGIAHDFNNLLTVINGYSRAAMKRLDPRDPSYGEVEEIRKAGERAANLTRQLLAFSRKQTLELEVLDLNAVVQDAERMLRRLIAADIEIRCVLEGGLPSIEADPGQLHQVIVNLAINARDAMPDGGGLTISTKAVRLREDSVEAPAAPAGEYVRLSVADTGCGMDENTRKHLFEPFFTTKAAGKGTGLGLSTVHGIVTQSGGHIFVQTEPDRGTRFEIYLPVVTQPVEAEPAESFAPALRGSETVLVAEDDAEVRAFTAGVLSSHGYRVLEAGQGSEALRVCREHSGRIDLLLSDIVMPGMSAAALGAEVRRLRPEAVLLLMTGYTDPETLRRLGVSRAADYLQKPFGPAELARKVRDVLDDRGRLRASGA